jgi:3-phenylpropionate/trans-cinnamate dioxygenase ferredoxin reductase subunit
MPDRSRSARYVLIGGGLAAGHAAKQIRAADTRGAIVVVGQEPYAPYDRPPLSKEFLRGEKAREELFSDAESFYRDHGIDLLLGVTARDMDTAGKTVRLGNGDVLSFEKALIATGGRPVRLKVPGADLPGVHYLRTLDDSAAIAAEAAPGRRAVIIGAGFIGLELAASLTQKGVRVTVVEAAPHIWARFADPALAGFFQDYCARKGVVFYTNEKVLEIRGDGRPSTVVTGSGRELPCDFVCIGVGIVPNVELPLHAGLAVDNGVVVNEYLQSSHPDIYAAGDVAAYLDPVFGKRRRVEHWGHAEYSGQLAGRNMAGAREPYDLLTYVWSDIFDLHLEFAGDESEHDQVLLRGRLQDGAFTVLYLRDGALTAYFAVNGDSTELPILQRLIRTGVILVGREPQLQDPRRGIQDLH